MADTTISANGTIDSQIPVAEWSGTNGLWAENGAVHDQSWLDANTAVWDAATARYDAANAAALAATGENASLAAHQQAIADAFNLDASGEQAKIWAAGLVRGPAADLAAAIQMPGSIVQFRESAWNDDTINHGDIWATATPLYVTTIEESQHQESYSYYVDTIVNTSLDYVNDSSVPKMRAKSVLFYVNGLKPYTKLYGGIEATNVDPFMVQCSELIVSNATGRFSGAKDIPVASDNIASRTFTETNSIWQFGELITFAGTNAGGNTAVVVSNYARLNVSNVYENVVVVVCNKGTALSSITTGCTITGTKSGSVATVSAINTFGAGAGTCDSLGNLFTVFNVPPNTFDTGTKYLTLTDNLSNDYELSLSKARQRYYAAGTQHNYLNVLTHQQILNTATYTVTDYTESTALTGYDVTFDVHDPLSQTFVLPDQYATGAMIESVDLFFYSNNDSLPITVQLVGTTNGYPNNEVYATTTLNPSDIVASMTSLVATNVKFYRLIYLEANKEYAIKVLSNSNKYRLWVSKMGEVDITTRKLISKQPSMGSLFMSQNNSTWSADQLRDLCFRLNVAKFDTSKTAIIDLFPIISESVMMANPFYTTNGSTRVRVTHFNHSLVAGNYITYTGSTASVFNTSYQVEVVTNSDSYTIILAAAATTTESVGGAKVIVNATQVKFDLARLYVDSYVPTNSSLIASIKTTGSNMVISQNYTNVPINQYWKQNNTAYLFSTENEAKLLNGAKSFTYQLQMSSSDSAFSPIVDLASIGLVTGANRAAYTTSASIGTTVFAEDLTTIVTASTHVSFSNTNQTITSTLDDFSNFIIGKYVLVSGATNAGNNQTYKINAIDYVNKVLSVTPLTLTMVNEAVGATVTIKQYDLICDSITPNGEQSEGCYQTIPIRLSNESSGLKILMDSQIPTGATLSVYYRTVLNSANGGLVNQTWTLIPSVLSIANNLYGFIEREYDALTLDAFNAFQIKIVMQSSESAWVPQVQNLRIIAVA